MSVYQFMKRNYKYLISIVLITGILLGFQFNNQPNPEKNKTIIQVLNYILREGHYQPKDINDTFSEGVFNTFIETLDPSKHYFYQSDIQEFKKYYHQIDNQFMVGDLTFFNVVYQKYLQRVKEANENYKEVLAKPFEITTNETYRFNYASNEFPKNRKEMLKAWEKQLKWRFVGILYDKEVVEKDMVKANANYQPKAMSVLELEALEKTKENMKDFFERLDEMNPDDYFALYINTIAVQFEPHTNYFDPKIKKTFDISMSGKLEGIGARLQKEGQYTKVFELISGGPAWRSGELEVGDIILKVAQGNGEPLDIVGMRLDNAIEFIKGKKGTEVKLTLKKVDGTIRVITLIRDIVEIEETFVKSSIVEKNGEKLGVINLPKFYFDMEGKVKRNAANDMAKEIARLEEEGVKGLLIDLRDNGGGSLKTAIDISGFFIDRGPVVQVKYRGEKPQIKEDELRGTLWDGPLVLLVNELSASASEIFAAAMQDYGRAVILGSKQTYGKGTVQNFYELNDYAAYKEDLGSLKMTIQKFYRINGGSTQLKGVAPDIVVPTKYAYLKVGEKDEKSPMSWDQIQPVSYEKWNNYQNFDQVVADSKYRISQNEQFALIEKNARWLAKNQDDDLVQLNYQNFKSEIKSNEEKAKEFEGLKTYNLGLNFLSPKYEKEIIAKDSLLNKKRTLWHKELNQDIVIEEGLNVLSQLKVKKANVVMSKP